MCSLSELKGDCPARNLRNIAENRSIKGIARTAKGSASGRSVGPNFSAEIALGSICPVNVIAEAASNNPRNIEPESPIKILAGWALCGRKPIHTPIITAVIRDGAPARLKP